MKVRCINKKDCFLQLEIDKVYNVIKILEYPDDTYYILSISDNIKVSHRRFVDLSYDRNKLIDEILNE